MLSVGQVNDHQEHCRPHVLTLRMLARGEGEPALAAAQAARATGAIIAEVEAAIQAALAADRGTHRHPADRAFPRARLNRLAAAAERVVAAARDEDTAGLRRHLRRFEALTSASWTLEHTVGDPAPPIRRWPAHGMSKKGTFVPGPRSAGALK